MMDNTWATPLYFRHSRKASICRSRPAPNISVAIPTSCSDVSRQMQKTLPALKNTVYTMGLCVGPTTMYLALRGLRTMACGWHVTMSRG